MCGLFGVMGSGITTTDINIIKELGTISQLRGTDGSGIFQIRSRTFNSAHSYPYEAFYKTNENFSSFLEDINHIRSNAPKSLLFSQMVDVIIGHVRSATKGSCTDENAHPFQAGQLVGAHNGTLVDGKYQRAQVTDSQLMFEDMDRRGIIPVLEEMDCDSAYALTIYDRSQRRVLFVRNEERPFAFAFLADREVMYWASEVEMLKFVLNRRQLKFKTMGLTPGKLVSVKADDITRKNYTDEKWLRSFTLVKHLDRKISKKWQTYYTAKAEYEEKRRQEEAKTIEGSTEIIPQTSTAIIPVADGKGKIDTVALKKATDAWQEAAGKVANEEKPKTNLQEVEYGKLKVEAKGEVVPFPKKQQEQKKPIVTVPARAKKRGNFTSRSLYSKCACGSKQLNLVECAKAGRGQLEGIRYSEEDDKFYCGTCDPQKEKVQA